MANYKCAEKRIRRDAKRTVLNHNRISRIRTFIRKVEDALMGTSKEAAQAAFLEAQTEIMRGVNKGALHINTAARKVSRLSKRVKALA